VRLVVPIEQGPAAVYELRAGIFGMPRGELLLDQRLLAGRQEVRIYTGKSAAELLLDQRPLAGRQRRGLVAPPSIELVAMPMALRVTRQTFFALESHLESHLDAPGADSNTDMANTPDAIDAILETASFLNLDGHLLCPVNR
jgi:hypothetical protein